jgi:hypothetical protein
MLCRRRATAGRRLSVRDQAELLEDGYSVILAEFLRDQAVLNPKHGGRSVIYGTLWALIAAAYVFAAAAFGIANGQRVPLALAVLLAISGSTKGGAHPPRSKPPRRSSLGPPNPCITPSTETLVVVVNLMLWSLLVSLSSVHLARSPPGWVPW